jgi:cell division protein ZapA
MVKTGRMVDVEPIDRLEEKVKLLIAMIDRLKGDAARLADDNARLSRELEAAHTRLSDAQHASGRSCRSAKSGIRCARAWRPCSSSSRGSHCSGGCESSRLCLTTQNASSRWSSRGCGYPVKSSLDPAYVAELAAYVDEKMRLASEANDTTDFLRVAVLAALNLADEIFRHRTERDDRSAVLATRAGELERLLDQVLASDPTPPLIQ